MILLVTVALGIAVGFVSGWCARSFRFVLDKDCANPDHE